MSAEHQQIPPLNYIPVFTPTQTNPAVSNAIRWRVSTQSVSSASSASSASQASSTSLLPSLPTSVDNVNPPLTPVVPVTPATPVVPATTVTTATPATTVTPATPATPATTVTPATTQPNSLPVLTPAVIPSPPANNSSVDQPTSIDKSSVPKPTLATQSSSMLIPATGDTHICAPLNPTIVNPNFAIANKILTDLRELVHSSPLDENNIIELVTDVINTVEVIKRGKETLTGEEKRSIVIYVINQIIQEAPVSDELRMFFNVVFIPLVLPPLVDVFSDYSSGQASCASCFPFLCK